MALADDGSTTYSQRQRMAYMPVLTSIGLTAVFALAHGIFLTVAESGHWGKTKKKTAYCEGINKDSNVRQPMNTWSNLAYIAAGSWTIGRAVQLRYLQRESQTSQSDMEKQAQSQGRWCASDTEAVMTLPAVLVALLGISAVALGWGSFMFHAAMTKPWQQVDVGAMYWVMNASLAAAVWRWLCWCTSAAPRSACALLPFVFIVVVADALMLAFKWKLSASVVFPAQLGVVIASEAALTALTSTLECARRKLLDRQFLFKQICTAVVAFLLGIVGLVFRQWGVREAKREDRDTNFCDPRNFFQPHAVWHLTTALAIFLLHEKQLLPVSVPTASSSSVSEDKGVAASAVIGQVEA